MAIILYAYLFASMTRLVYWRVTFSDYLKMENVKCHQTLVRASI